MLVAVVLTTVFACKTKKVAQNNVAVKPVKVNTVSNLCNSVALAQNNSNYYYFTSSARYKDASLNQDLNLEVQCKKGEFIWVNVKVLFVNVARIMFTTDSVRIINYINREYSSASYAFLQKYTPLYLSYKQIEQLVYGNLLFDAVAEKSTIDSSSGIFLRTLVPGAEQWAALGSNHKPTEVILKENTGKKVKVNYSAPAANNNNAWPTHITIHIESEKKVDCELDNSNLAFELKREPSFVVPKSYKVQVFK